MVANILQKKLNLLSNKEKKEKYGDFYLLEKAQSVGVLIECGFITNKEDLNNLINKRYQKKIVENIIEGIFEYFQYKVL